MSHRSKTAKMKKLW